MAFNPEYLAQGIDVTPGDEVVLETIDALKPAVLRSTETPGLPLPPDARPGQLSSVRLEKLWLTDFRSYESAELALAPGLTAVLGDNGQGKSNLLEAVAWLATLASFRGAPTEALVRVGAAQAVLRAEGERATAAADADRGRAGAVGPQPGAGRTSSAWPAPATCSGCCGSRCSPPTTSSS